MSKKDLKEKAETNSKIINNNEQEGLGHLGEKSNVNNVKSSGEFNIEFSKTVDIDDFKKEYNLAITSLNNKNVKIAEEEKALMLEFEKNPNNLTTEQGKILKGLVREINKRMSQLTDEQLKPLKNFTRTGVESKISSSERSQRLGMLALTRGPKLRLLRNRLGISIEKFGIILAEEDEKIGRIERCEVCMGEQVAEYYAMRLKTELGKNVPLPWLLNGYIEGNTEEERKVNEEKMLDEFDRQGISPKRYFEIRESSGVSNEDRIALSEEAMIAFETQLFKKFNKNSISMLCRDNKMAPVYKKGEYLAGILVNQDFFYLADGYDCIVETQEKKGFLMARRFFVDKSTGRYILMGYEDPAPIVLNKPPLKLAIISLRRVFHTQTPHLRMLSVFGDDSFIPQE